MTASNNKNTADFAKRFAWCLGGTCLAIGIVSLSLAYRFGGLTWNRRFGQLGDPDGMAVGYWFELARLILIVGLTMFVLCDGFSVELQQVFGLRSWRSDANNKPGHAKWVIVFRCFFVVSAVVLAMFKSSEVFDLSENGAPAQLVQWGFDPQHAVYDRGDIVDIQQIWRQAQWAYLFYTAYAQVIYAIFIPLLVTVSLFAVITTDIRYLSSERTAGADENSPGNDVERFREFKNECYRRAMRYLNLYAAISLVLLFLQWDPVLPEREHQWVRAMAYFLSVVAAIFFIYVWMVYHDYWHRVTCAVEDEEAADKFSAANAPLEFFKSMFKQPLPGLAIAGLAVMLLRNLLPFLYPG